MTSDERPYGIWLWCILLVFILGYVVVADWWLHSQGHEFMTTEFKEGLDNTVWGPIVTALWFGTWIGLTFHFYIAKR
jgi:hypothetical protein